jgi:ribonucleoside-diphosphate reductase alpha chain
VDVWKSILVKGGSVQHLSFLNENEKNVFKTFGELSQLELVQNASIIQKYIDQGISLNTLISKSASVKDRNLLLIEAWKLGLKSLYYQRGVNSAQEVSRNILECSSCEG